MKSPRIHQIDAIESVIKSKIDNPIVVLPTGSGKSLVLAHLCKQYSDLGKTVVVLSHVKEILEQNHEEIKELIPHVGLYSSMLNSKTREDVTVAGIQSVCRKADKWKGVDVVIIDEAHRCNTKEGTMYDVFFKGIGEHKRIGLTATPFRLGGGYIYGKDMFFDGVACDWGSPDKYKELIDLGYICPLTTKRTEQEMDLKDIDFVGGDYNAKQLKDKFDRIPITEAAVKEIMAAGVNRDKWLIFAIDIDHAEHIAEVLIRNGIKTVPVHSKMEELGFSRGDSIEGLKYGDYKCGVTVNVLTTGFDSPRIDLIASLRPTSSPALHVQMLGRGTRVSHNKKNCLVLDFSGNCARLGNIDDPLVTIKGKGKGGGEPILKECPVCKELLAPAVRNCPCCSHVFKFEHNLLPLGDDIFDDLKPHWVDVGNVTYKLKMMFAGPTSIEVNYYIGQSKPVTELLCIEHKGFARSRALHWLKYRGASEDVKHMKSSEIIETIDGLMKPKKILVQKKNKYLDVCDAVFGT